VPSAAVELYRDDALLIVDKPSGTATEDVFTALKQTHPYVAMHHRLDLPASGCLLFGLDKRANKQLAAGFRQHAIQRTYRAALWGVVDESMSWEWPLARKSAHTDVRPLANAQGMTLAEIRLKTGRKHQIRQHAAMAGLPIVGDRRYGGQAGRAWPRLALHAWRLELSHPIHGAAIKVQAAWPPDLQGLPFPGADA
jgi:23S rRNA-/tRNA-specific pseudouridylate synthase